MSLIDVPLLTKISTPIKTTSLPSDAYVLFLASLSSHYAASASAPMNTIHLYDKSYLQRIQDFTGHQVATTCMRSVPSLAGSIRETLISCGKDGAVIAWDERSSNGIALKMQALGTGGLQALMSCDASADGLTVAAGSALQGEDAPIFYWDPRNPAAPIRTHTSTHSEDITAVHFLRKKLYDASRRNIVLTASSDGLICTSNADEQDEDEAGLHVGNWGCSIAQAGWIHGRTGSPAIWAASDMETFSVWSGELDQAQDVDIRQPSVHRQDFTWVTDYLIGCHSSNTFLADHDNDLSIFTGSNEGDIALLTRSSFSDPATPWSLQRLWTTGHAGIVRSFLWDEENNILLTGGEDSKINAWSSPPFASQDVSSPKRENDSMDVDDDTSIPQRKRQRA